MNSNTIETDFDFKIKLGENNKSFFNYVFSRKPPFVKFKLLIAINYN